MNRLRKRRSGFSLVELLVAVIVLGILAAIVLNSGSAAQRRARMSTAMTVLKDYENAFSECCLAYPGMMMDRQDAWGDDGSGYTTKEAMTRLVTRMNTLLDTDLQLLWDDEIGYYRSQAKDPWGGYYTLMEYPYFPTDMDGYDPTTGKGVSAMRCSFWATGIDDTIINDLLVTDRAIGVALTYQGGYVYDVYSGIQDGVTPLAGCEIEHPY